MAGETADRPPCICPGGMMNMCTTDLMDYAGVSWPEAHLDAKLMADLAQACRESGCFDNVGVPFCMTVEAESMGARVTMGSRRNEPRVTEYAIQSVSQWKKIKPIDLHTGRAQVVLDAVHILKLRNPDAPVIGNVTGPVSTAGSLLEPAVYYRELRKRRTEAHEYMKFVSDELTRFALAQVQSGADVITLSDPGGTGEILGPQLFEEYTVRYINQIIDEIRKTGARTIAHICGQLHNVYEQFNEIHADVLSVESCVSIRKAKSVMGSRVMMGNVSTQALQFADPQKIRMLTNVSREEGADIIAPACGIGTGSPIGNICAMKECLEETTENP